MLVCIFGLLLYSVGKGMCTVIMLSIYPSSDIN